MDNSAEKKYAEFEEKVKRTVYFDNLSPQVTASVLRNALDQFGSVTKVKFILNYTIQKDIPACALVEMKTAEQANAVVAEVGNLPFMMSGFPRPVRACNAEEEMFEDRPEKPGRKIQVQWLDEGDPGFEEAKKLKQLTRKHAAEASFLLKAELEEEKRLADEHAQTLKKEYKKLETVENALKMGSVRHIASSYGVNILEEH